jgi:hypothetical protein
MIVDVSIFSASFYLFTYFLIHQSETFSEYPAGTPETRLQRSKKIEKNIFCRIAAMRFPNQPGTIIKGTASSKQHFSQVSLSSPEQRSLFLKKDISNSNYIIFSFGQVTKTKKGKKKGFFLLFSQHGMTKKEKVKKQVSPKFDKKHLLPFADSFGFRFYTKEIKFCETRRNRTVYIQSGRSVKASTL